MKSFYLIYISLLYFLIYYSHLKKYFFEFLKSKLFILISFFVFFSFFFNFVNSSCFVFPAKFTCYEKLPWSISKDEVENVKVWYELWAKGGATPNFVVENRLDYIDDLNWVQNWLNVYFFNKMSDYLLSITLLATIFYLIFFSKEKINFKKRKDYTFVIFLILYLVEWFLFHPSLRYGGYHIFYFIGFHTINNEH